MFQRKTSGPIVYEPGECTSGLFGGDWNWRGPIHYNLGDECRVERPTGWGKVLTLGEGR